MGALIMRIGFITVVVWLGLLVPGTACAQQILRASNTPVIFQPSTSIDSLLAKYSQVHSKPNEYWQLTDEEWTRYEHIKKTSPWASWRNNASPLAVLAHYSSSLDEKRKYARIEAELDTWRQHAIVEFQSLYDKERSIVYQRYADWIARRKPTLSTLGPQDRLRLFIAAGKCDPHCRTLVAKVLGSHAKLDIFVVGAKSDEAIFTWAESAAIPIERVKTREVTLNHDNGLFKTAVIAGLGLPLKRLPTLLKQSPGGDQVVAI
jgi:integrating conjugative element protein (TIGR03759 family)